MAASADKMTSVMAAIVERPFELLSLDRYSCFSEDSRKLLSEVAIREVDAVHAARE